MCWGRQAECACVRVSGVWLRVPDAGPPWSDPLPSLPHLPPQLLYFKGGPWPWRVGGAWFPRQFSLSHHSSFSPRASVHARMRTQRGRSLPTPVPLAFPPITSRLPPPPPLAAQARHFRGGPGGGDGRRGRPTLDPSNSVTTSLLGGNVLALCSLSPARPLSPRTLASSQPECVCGGQSAPPAKAQAP